jgi:hypothetical protein
VTRRFGVNPKAIQATSNGKEYVRVNSGFVIAYDINDALTAIRKTRSALCAKTQ